MNSPNGEPAWKQRAVERSIRTARVRAGQRVQRFLDAARAIIAEKGGTDFTVQEVVDRSGQSLRSFYLQFDGKHQLLLALFEDALSRAADRIRGVAAAQQTPLQRLQVAVTLLFELSRSDPAADQPLFTAFAPRLLAAHPGEVKLAQAPVVDLFAELMDEAADAGDLGGQPNPRRLAAMTVQSIIALAQPGGAPDDDDPPITGDEVWMFCSRGIVGH